MGISSVSDDPNEPEKKVEHGKSDPAERDQDPNIENGVQQGHDKDDATQSTDNRDKMKKNITILRGIALVVGSVIGTGIFITPNSITRNVKSPATSIMVWLAGGVISAIGGLVFCELGTMIPISGAEVVYIRKIYGKQAAFVSVWLIHFLLGGMRLAIAVLAFTKYFWPLFYGDPEADVNWWVSKLVSLLVLCVIVSLVAFKPSLILNCIVLFTTTKFLSAMVIVGAGFVYLAKGNTANIAVGFKGTNTDPKEWGDAWNGVIWSYMGWEEICIVASEIQNPQRNIPIIVICSISIVTAIYLLIITSFHIVLPLNIMVQDTPVASEFGMATMGEAGKIILALTVVISILGMLQCTFVTYSRYIHAGSVEGLLPTCLGLVSRRFRTPIVAIFYLAFVTTIFVLVGGIDDLIGSASFTRFPFLVMCSVGVFVMRRTHPDLHRPYRVPLIFPALFILFGVFVFIIPFLGEDWLISLIWVLILLLGVPLYYILLENVFKWKFPKKLDDNVTSLVMRVLDCE